MRKKNTSYLQKIDMLRSNPKIPIAIKTRMDQRGISYNQLGKIFDISRQSIQSYVTGTSQKAISQWTLMKICEYLGIRVEILVEFVDE